MALGGTGDAWGDAVVAALPSIPQDRVMTAGEVSEFWRIIKGVDASHIVSNAEVESDGTTQAHGLGAPAPIVDLPGVVK